MVWGEAVIRDGRLLPSRGEEVTWRVQLLRVHGEGLLSLCYVICCLNCPSFPLSPVKPSFFSGKCQIFWAEAISQNKKYVYIFVKKWNSLKLSSEMKCPKSGLFTDNYWVGWVGQNNFKWNSIVYNVNSFISLIAYFRDHLGRWWVMPIDRSRWWHARLKLLI